MRIMRNPRNIGLNKLLMPPPNQDRRGDLGRRPRSDLQSNIRIPQQRHVLEAIKHGPVLERIHCRRSREDGGAVRSGEVSLLSWPL